MRDTFQRRSVAYQEDIALTRLGPQSGNALCQCGEFATAPLVLSAFRITATSIASCSATPIGQEHDFRLGDFVVDRDVFAVERRAPSRASMRSAAATKVRGEQVS
jgi:hypothetical protein